MEKTKNDGFTGNLYSVNVAYSVNANTGKGVTIVDEVIRLVLHEELDGIEPALAEWVRAKKPGHSFKRANSPGKWGISENTTPTVDEYEQALLADLEAND